MVTAIDPATDSATSAIVSTVAGGVDIGLIGTVLVVLVVLTLGIFIFRKFKDNKNYDILVEVTPKWSLKTHTLTQKTIVQPTKLEALMGKKARVVEQEVPIQTHSVYYVPGAYVFNKQTGTYELYLKDKNKSKVPNIDYNFFTPITFGKFKRALGLWQESPSDFKPYITTFAGTDKIRHVYDSESTWVALKTQDEIRQKFLKESTLQKWLPIIVLIVMALVFIISMFIVSKQIGNYSKALGSFTGELSKLTKIIASVP